MTEIVKICNHHGSLTEEQVRRYGKRVRCFKCIQIKNDKYRRENLEYYAQKSLEHKWKNIDKVRAYYKEDRQKNPEKYRIQYERYRKNNLNRRRLSDILNKFDITLSTYEKMIEIYENKCAICRKEETRKSRTKGQICSLSIDHCHATNKIRGLLCAECNTGIGKFRDSVKLLESAIQYLQADRDWRQEQKDLLTDETGNHEITRYTD